MLFSRKKIPSTENPNLGGSEFLSPREKILASPVTQDSSALIKFEQVSFDQQIQKLNCEIKPGAWVLLYGDDTLTKALFCDLSFGFVQPTEGIISPVLSSSQLSFLGNAHTTYGATLFDHLFSGVRERSRILMEYVISQIFSQNLRERLLEPQSFVPKNNGVLDLKSLSEKDLLEIAEANVLLQNRQAVIVDMSASFYKKAIAQGFKHSELFLNSGKTVFWMIDESSPAKDLPWMTKREVPQLNFYFGTEAQLRNIN